MNDWKCPMRRYSLPLVSFVLLYERHGLAETIGCFSSHSSPSINCWTVVAIDLWSVEHKKRSFGPPHRSSSIDSFRRITFFGKSIRFHLEHRWSVVELTKILSGIQMWLFSSSWRRSFQCQWKRVDQIRSVPFVFAINRVSSSAHCFVDWVNRSAWMKIFANCSQSSNWSVAVLRLLGQWFIDWEDHLRSPPTFALQPPMQFDANHCFGGISLLSLNQLDRRRLWHRLCHSSPLFPWQNCADSKLFISFSTSSSRSALPSVLDTSPSHGSSSTSPLNGRITPPRFLHHFDPLKCDHSHWIASGSIPHLLYHQHGHWTSEDSQARTQCQRREDSLFLSLQCATSSHPSDHLSSRSICWWVEINRPRHRFHQWCDKGNDDLTQLFSSGLVLHRFELEWNIRAIHRRSPCSSRSWRISLLNILHRPGRELRPS